MSNYEINSVLNWISKQLGLNDVYGQLMVELVLNESTVDLVDRNMFKYCQIMSGYLIESTNCWKIKEHSRFWN